MRRGEVPASSVDSHWNRFVEDPGDRAVFELLEEQLFMAADWQRLADLYRRRSAAPALADRAPERAQLALRLGQLLEERVRDVEAAIQIYTEAVRLDPTLHRALTNLRRIYAARRSWEAVLQIGEQQAALAGNAEERARIYAEMGDIWLREVEDPTQAEKLYARARAETGGTPETEEPDDSLVQSAWLAAARGETDAALAALEDALERNPASVEALDMMCTVLEGAERHEEMTALLERRASLASDPETRGAVLMRLGQIREQLDDLTDAREAYERTLAAHPDHAAAREALRRVYRLLEAWSPLRRLLEGSVELSSGPTQLDLLCELADLLEFQLGEPDTAREHLELARDLAPEDPRPLEGLARLGVESTQLTLPDFDAPAVSGEPRGSRVVEVLERKLADCEAHSVGLSPESARLRLRIGELRASALGDATGAVEALEPLLDRDDTLLDAAPALSGLYEQLGRQRELILLAENAARLSEASEQRIYWYRRAAETARAIGEPERAISCYQELVAHHPNDHGARAALCDLFRSRGDQGSLAGLLRDEIGRTGESREFEVQLELADLSEEGHGGPMDTVAHLRRCLEIEPRREDLLERALRACEAQGGALAQLDLVEHVAACAKAQRDRAALLVQRGIVLADGLDWQEEAAESWRSALELDPEQPLARSRLGSSL